MIFIFWFISTPGSSIFGVFGVFVESSLDFFYTLLSNYYSFIVPLLITILILTTLVPFIIFVTFILIVIYVFTLCLSVSEFSGSMFYPYQGL